MNQITAVSSNPQPMHLALVISSLSPGGAERVLSGLANYWVSKGRQVSLITFAASTAVPFYSLDPRINLVQLDQTQHIASPIKRVINSFKRILVLKKTFQQLNPDRILSFVDITNITTLMASFGLKTPVIVAERTHPGHYKIPRLYNVLRRWVYPRAHCVVVQTQGAKDYFKGLKNLSIIPNFVSAAAQTKTYASIKNIMSVGRLCPFKGFDTLILSFSKLFKIFPDLTLTIYGEGRERKNLESLITSLNLQHKVHLPGTTKNIQEALLQADLFIFPSHYEGFPNALCEAMAVGLPVIASACSGTVDIVREGIDGRLFPVGDVEALTTIALELLGDPMQCKRLGQSAKEISTRFSPTHVFALWDQVLKETL
jgi:GalNAc-alpha-(1->4)-GalNAc-alpha-(1->3)-diNAcBac-PP-undecaprenol alpha-1,4-N-acetyl-D-galactosaminyltransferase